MVVDVISKHLPEKKRFYRGLTDWIGFSRVTLNFDVAPRHKGKSGWSLHSLISLALTAIFSFTATPLRIISFLGIVTLILAIFISCDALLSWLNNRAVSGFATIIITLLFIGSSMMISLGIIGEYIAKIYEEIKQRPSFIIERSYEKKEAS
jgi:hypothetical protein